MGGMTHAEFLESVRSRAARSAATASAVRGRGNTGSVIAARTFLRRLDLTPFGSSPSFAAALDSETERLRDVLPIGAQHWGMARKLLNIFLRDCFYTTYLDEAFHLRSAEALFELPLDSITAKRLTKVAGGSVVPPWRGVKHLSEAESTRFQEAAEAEARRRGIARVHLDAVWWSQSRDDEGT